MFSQLAECFTDCSGRAGKSQIEAASLAKAPFHSPFAGSIKAIETGSPLHTWHQSVQSWSTGTAKRAFPHAKKYKSSLFFQMTPARHIQQAIIKYTDFRHLIKTDLRWSISVAKLQIFILNTHKTWHYYFIYISHYYACINPADNTSPFHSKYESLRASFWAFTL